MASIEPIIAATQRAAELTQQMLAYAGKGRFIMQPLDLNTLITEMAQLLKASIVKNATLQWQLAPHLPAIEADASQIRQIVLNLIVNASEAFGDQDGDIILYTGAMRAERYFLTTTYLGSDLPAGYYVYLEVRDTGTGMDAETLAKIFEPFFTTKFTGRGLGLAAVLGIVRSHGGALKVVSEVGRGTTFTILFPCLGYRPETIDSHARPIAAPKDRTGPASPPSAGTILVIDDEEAVRMMATRILERFGFTVLSAADGQAGVDLFRAHAATITCVLLDLTMPHLSGDQTFHAIRAIRPDARIVLMSGYGEEEATSRFGGAGLAGFLQKPFTLNKLRDTIAPALPAAAGPTAR